MLTLFFDTETTGVVHRDLPLEHAAQPNLVQLAAILCDETQRELSQFSVIIRPEGWMIPQEAAAIHGITDHRARAQGVPLISALALFSAFCANVDKIVGHNLAFDISMVERSYWQVQRQSRLPGTRVCTMLMAKDLMKLPSKYIWSKDPYKYPNLGELHTWCFGQGFDGAHDALADVRATLRSYYHMLGQGHPEVTPRPVFRPIVKESQVHAGQTRRTFEFLEFTLRNLTVDVLGDWDRQFILDMRAKLDTYGERIMVTDRQWPHIERLHDSHLKQLWESRNEKAN